MIAAMAVFIFALGIGLRPALFSVTNDEDFAIATGLPVDKLSMLIAVLAAVTVAVSMRVVGALLVSALMIIPIAATQTFSKSFSATMGWGMALGAAVSVAGLAVTYLVDVSPGGMIVVLAVLVYATLFIAKTLFDRRKAPAK